jgi:hypothetical protein
MSGNTSSPNMQAVLDVQVQSDHAATNQRSKKLLWTGFGIGLALVLLLICIKPSASSITHGTSHSLAFKPLPAALPRSAAPNSRGPMPVAAGAAAMPENKPLSKFVGVDVPTLLAHHLYAEEGLKLDGVDVEPLWKSAMLQQLGEEAEKEYVEGVAPANSNLNGLNLVQELQQTGAENWERIWQSPMMQQVRQEAKKCKRTGCLQIGFTKSSRLRSLLLLLPCTGRWCTPSRSWG